MSGNVWEWCQDYFYNTESTTANSDDLRVLRGGSYWCGAGACSVSWRISKRADLGDCGDGLRLVLPIGG